MMIVRLYADHKVKGQRWSNKVYQVSSETNEGVWYYVWIPANRQRIGTCNCPSFAFRKSYSFECKHIDAARKVTI